MSRISRAIVLASISAFALLIAPSMSAAQGILMDDFSNANPVRFSLTAVPEIRRGTVTTITIMKDLIDLVPTDQISATAANLSEITKGRMTDNGRTIGFVKMKVNVHQGETPGGFVQISVGLIDKYKFKVVRQGRIIAVTYTPEPSTVQPGTPIQLAMTGVDIGTADIVMPACHTGANFSSSNGSIHSTLTRGVNCSVGAGPFAVRLSSTTDSDPNRFTTNTGDGSFTFKYAAAPATGVGCITLPSIGHPQIQSPGGGTVLNFLPATPSPANVTVTWANRTVPDQAIAPNGEFEVGMIVNGGIESLTPVVGTSITLKVPIPASVLIRVRARNCGTPGPRDSVAFTTKRQ